MKAESVTVVDGQTYQPGQEIWDLGSFECTGAEGQRRSYEGLQTDAQQHLPRYDNLLTGSSALCVDSGNYYKYQAPTKRWYLVGGDGEWL